MKHALLYNVFCCWMVTAIGGITARHIIYHRDRGDVDRSFALFWLLASALWFFSGLRLIFYSFGWHALDRAFFFVVQFFVMIHILPGTLHTALKLSSNRRFLIMIMSFSTLSTAVFGFFILYDGIVGSNISDWGSEYSISDRAFWFFLPPFALVAFGNFFDLLRKIFFWRILKSQPLEHTLATVAFCIYLLAGIFDLKGYLAGWGLLIERASYMLAALISYVGYTWRNEAIFMENDLERKDR